MRSGRKWTTPVVASLLVSWFLLATVGDSGERSATYDEPLHLVGGWSYWKLRDYRLHPTNGPLMQRWLTLPFFLDPPTLPPTDGADFRKATGLGEDFGVRFLFERNSDSDGLLQRSRAMNAALGLALASVVAAASRWAFGVSGLLAAVLVCFCPNVIAHAGLATSDVGAALAFLAATFCWSRLLDGITPVRLLCSALSWGVLAGVKMSAPLILPILLLAALPTVIGRRAWRVRFGRWFGRSRRPTTKLAMLGALIALHLAAADAMVWSYYGFRFSAMQTTEPELDDFSAPWPVVVDRLGASGGAIVGLRDHRVLPEAYLYGVAHTLRYSQQRPAYLNGRYSSTGWWYYFPLVFLLKTPLPTLALFVVALRFGWNTGPSVVGTNHRRARRRRLLRRFWPFLALVVGYGAAACSSNLNIGYRHLLPILPPLFVLAGSLERASLWTRRLVWLLVGWLVVECMLTRPSFLAYFNAAAGGRDRGYLRLTDSNVDWGQDLPALSRWIRERRAAGDETPIYLDHFGIDEPKRFGIDALEPFSSNAASTGGWYCISATILTAPSRGKPLWGDEEERQYQELLALVAQGAFDNDERRRKLAGEHLLRAKQWRLYYALFKRNPDRNVGGSILVFRLSDEEVKRCLFGPPPHR